MFICDFISRNVLTIKTKNNGGLTMKKKVMIVVATAVVVVAIAALMVFVFSGKEGEQDGRAHV